MLLSKNWLSQFIDLEDKSAQEIAEKLTLSTVEIENYENQAENLENMVVGKIREIKDHPNADNLEICMTDIGEQVVQIICGGSNIEEGQKVAVAKVGAKVRWHGEGELVELEETEIRGKNSKGMIAAANEIGLEDKFPMEDENEILDLSQNEAEVGTELAEAVNRNDVIFEIDNKSMTRRPDLWSHYGISRELSVLFYKKLEDYSTDDIEVKSNSDLEVNIEDKELCPRYSAISISGVEVEESPQWLQDRLNSVDVEPVNNIVDITNNILMELGQPMHAFDKEKIAGHEINVRRAQENEKLEALDDSKYELSSNNLVIADKNKPIALAGIIGAKNSEVEKNSSEIVLESANFDRVNVRRSAMELGIRTDSSSRFEKGQDPNKTMTALKKAVELIKQVCPQAEINSVVIDKSNFDLNQSSIEISLDYIQTKIGAEIETQTVKNILESLEFEVEKSGDEFSVGVPSFRATVDITQKDDLIEEIARIYGYNNIDSQLPDFPISPSKFSPLKKLEAKVKDTLCYESGFSETQNYSFVSEEIITKLNNDLSDYIELKNPIAKDRPYLRRNLIFNLLEAAEDNLDRYKNIALFETGKVFIKENVGEFLTLEEKERLPEQDLHLAAVISKENEDTPFFSAKTALEDVSNRLKIELEYKQQNIDSEVFHSGRYGEMFSKGVKIGFVSELHPLAQKKFDIDQRVGLFEVDLNKLLENKDEQEVYTKVPKYPAVSRDIAFLVGKKVQYKDIRNTIEDINELIESVELFDVYTGENIGEDKKNLAYHIHYRADDRTLNSDEIDEIHSEVETALTDKFDVEIRD